jgi:nitrogen fixation protein FixH
MATWDIQSVYYSGQGVVLMGERDPITGRPLGLKPIGNVSSLKISIDTASVEHKESQTGQRAVDFRLITETKASLSMTIEHYSRENLALALRGDGVLVPAGSITGMASKFFGGAVMPLGHVNVSSVVVTKGATTLVEYTGSGSWDYKVNADAGSIMFNGDSGTLATSGLTDGDALAIDYSYAAQVRVDALTQAAPERFLRFEGLNTLGGNTPVIIEVPRFVIDPAKEYSLIP